MHVDIVYFLELRNAFVRYRKDELCGVRSQVVCFFPCEIDTIIDDLKCGFTAFMLRLSGNWPKATVDTISINTIIDFIG